MQRDNRSNKGRDINDLKTESIEIHKNTIHLNRNLNTIATYQHLIVRLHMHRFYETLPTHVRQQIENILQLIENLMIHRHSALFHLNNDRHVSNS